MAIVGLAFVQPCNEAGIVVQRAATTSLEILPLPARLANAALSVVVYLRASPEELFRRLRHDTQRPLLQVADPLRKLRELYRDRDAFYRETAHFVIETGRPSVPTLVNMILMQLELAGVVPDDERPLPGSFPSRSRR